MDHLTRYAEAIPIKQMTVQECARAYATRVMLGMEVDPN
jgi:hypothetical protein